jgi:CRISPR-associated protein Cmr2
LSGETGLLTFSIGPVHTLIAQARRVADLWAGSDLLSSLTAKAVMKIQSWPGAEMVFPSIADDQEVPPGFPNRFVCRVPLAEAGEIAQALREEVLTEWDRQVTATVQVLRAHELGPAAWIWSEEATRGSRQTDHLLEIAWSWVPEGEDYAAASLEGARRFAAVRLFRPFSQIEERGEKCILCGERTALPDGQRNEVIERWAKAAGAAEGTANEGFLRQGQTRLCLVCATKRLYPQQHGKSAYFTAFDRFQPSEEDSYFALVSMDGDHMGKILGWAGERIAGRNVEAFHRAVSAALSRFAEGLRTPGRPDLNLSTLGRSSRGRKNPQLVYAGGEDVILVCDPREALGIAWSIRGWYRECLREIVPLLAERQDFDRSFTISAGILFGHTKHPAGLLFRDVERLLNEVAKEKAGRDAVAIRLVKRGGVPVETAFHWDEATGAAVGAPTWVDLFDHLIGDLTTGKLSSRQTFTLRRQEQILAGVFAQEEQWTAWLTEQLSRREVASAGEVAARLAPFFLQEKTGALRILRFLTREAAA